MIIRFEQVRVVEKCVTLKVDSYVRESNDLFHRRSFISKRNVDLGIKFSVKTTRL